MRDLSSRRCCARSQPSITIDAGQSTSALNAGRRTEDSGFWGSDRSMEQGTFGSTGVIGSSLGGKTVVLDVGHDIRIRGSNVVSDQGTELWAGNNITIEAATQTRDSQYVREESKSDMFDASSGWTWGQQDMRSTSNRTESTAVGSTVGAIAGNVVITAGNRYSQVGSDVVAPGGTSIFRRATCRSSRRAKARRASPRAVSRWVSRHP
ncbi:hemagglutinin repeat-containing protein [Variovorax paradoxus]|jgi:filamentous hemagglutinin|uniref:hemagglutinin repeat-containing protein n=1 Tax=Variovorax paradoxus TaxID=34073 RepID=UPI000486B5C6